MNLEKTPELTVGEKLFLTHKGAVSRLELFEEYTVMALEILRSFLFILADQERGDTLAASPFVNSLILKFKNILAKSKQGIASPLIAELVEDLRIKLSCLTKLSLAEETRAFLTSDQGKTNFKALTLYLSQMFGSADNKNTEGYVPFTLRKNMVRKNRHENHLGTPCTNEVFRRSVQDIQRQVWFSKYCEEEFQQLIYQGDDIESQAKFRKFLIGIIKYLEPSQNAEKEIVRFGLRLLNSYLYPTSKRIGKVNLKSRQDYLFSCKLADLLCALVSSSNDHEIIFLSLQTANSLLRKAGQDKQVTFIDTIKAGNFHAFLGRSLMAVRSLLSELERDLTKENSQNLLKQMFSIGSEEVRAEPRKDSKVQSMIVYYHFLTALCTEQNKLGQAFIRSQEENEPSSNPRSINLLMEACDHLKAASRLINRQSIVIANSILELLTDATSGPNVENQKLLLSFKVVDIVRDILSEISLDDQLGLAAKGFSSADAHSQKLLDKCYFSCINLLLAVIEGSADKKLFKEISEIVDFKELLKRLISYVDKYSEIQSTKKSVTGDNFEPEILALEFLQPVYDKDMQMAFTLFYLIKIIKAYSEFYNEEVNELTGKEKLIYDFFDLNTASIEVNFQGSVHRIFFTKYPSCYYYSIQNQINFMNEVKRETPNQKVSDFAQTSTIMFNEMEYTFKLKKSFKIDPLYSWYLRVASLAVCYLLNFYLLVSAEFKVVNQVQQDNKQSYNEPFVRTLAYIYLVFISLAFLLFYTDTVNINRINKWITFIRQLKMIPNLSAQEKTFVQSYLDRDILTFKQRDYHDLIRFKRQKEGCSVPVPWLTKLAYDLMFIDRQLYILIFYFVCVAGGLATNDYLLFCVPLLDIIVDLAD